MEKKFIKVVVTITVIISVCAILFSIYVLIHRLRNNSPTTDESESSEIIRYLDFEPVYELDHM